MRYYGQVIVIVIGLVLGGAIGFVAGPWIHRSGGRPAAWKAALGSTIGFVVILLVPESWQPALLAGAVSMLLGLAWTSPKLRGRP